MSANENQPSTRTSRCEELTTQRINRTSLTKFCESTASTDAAKGAKGKLTFFRFEYRSSERFPEWTLSELDEVHRFRRAGRRASERESRSGITEQYSNASESGIGDGFDVVSTLHRAWRQQRYGSESNRGTNLEGENDPSFGDIRKHFRHVRESGGRHLHLPEDISIRCVVSSRDCCSLASVVVVDRGEDEPITKSGSNS